ncbi:MAG: sugar ABC transporter permease [Clostridia bacterium]|nr:sugar ABC transporter permease [Clostridia bacterium]
MESKSVLAVLKKNVMLIVLVLVYVLFVILTKGGFFSANTFTDLVKNNAYVFILGAGMLMCMLTGGNIDLSCGATVCLFGALGAFFMSTNMGTEKNPIHVLNLGTPLSILMMLGIGVLYGSLLGYLIAYVRIPPWIATLTFFLAFRGLGTALLNWADPVNKSLAYLPESFLQVFYKGVLFPTEGFNWPCFVIGLLAAGAVVFLLFYNRNKRKEKGYSIDPLYMTCLKGGISAAGIILLMTQLAMDKGLPVPLLWVVGIILIYSFITSKTTIGRHFYVVGSNMEAARLSGVNTRRIMFLAYLNMAVLTTLATMINMARFQTAMPNAGLNYEMDAIAACVVGGVSASGGAGTIIGMVIGATLIGVINLGMIAINLDQHFQYIVKGFVLLAAVAFDILSQKKNK